MAKLFIIFAFIVCCVAAVCVARKIEKREAGVGVGFDFTPVFPANKFQKKYVGLEEKFPALYAPRHLNFGPHGPYGFGYKQYGGLAYPSFAYGEGYVGYPGNYGGIYG